MKIRQAVIHFLPENYTSVKTQLNHYYPIMDFSQGNRSPIVLSG